MSSLHVATGGLLSKSVRTIAVAGLLYIAPTTLVEHPVDSVNLLLHSNRLVLLSEHNFVKLHMSIKEIQFKLMESPIMLSQENTYIMKINKPIAVDLEFTEPPVKV